MIPGITGSVQRGAGGGVSSLQYVGGKTYAYNASAPGFTLDGLTGGTDSAAAVGDFIVVMIGGSITSGGAQFSTIPAGLSLFHNVNYDPGDQARARCYSGFLSDLTHGGVLAGSGSTGQANCVVVQVWRGAAGFDVAFTWAQGANAVDPAAITPTTPGSHIGVMSFLTHKAGTVNFSDPSDLILPLKNAHNTSGNDGAIMGALKTDWAGGAFDPAAWVHSGTASNRGWQSITFAVGPA